MIKEVDKNFQFGNVNPHHIFDLKKGERHFVLLTQNGKSLLGGASTDKDLNIIKIYIMPYITDLEHRKEYELELKNYIDNSKKINNSVLKTIRTRIIGGE